MTHSDLLCLCKKKNSPPRKVKKNLTAKISEEWLSFGVPTKYLNFRFWNLLMPFWDHAFFRIAPQIYRRAKKVENTTSYVLRGNFNLPIPHSSAVTTTLSITIDWDCKGKLLFENYPTHLSWSKNPTFWIVHGHYQWIPSALEPYKKILIKPEILNKRKKKLFHF